MLKYREGKCKLTHSDGTVLIGTIDIANPDYYHFSFSASDKLWLEFNLKTISEYEIEYLDEKTEKKMKNFLISGNYQKGYTHGAFHHFVEMEKRSEKEIIRCVDEIKQEMQYVNCVITNIIPLEDD